MVSSRALYQTYEMSLGNGAIAMLFSFEMNSLCERSFFHTQREHINIILRDLSANQRDAIIVKGKFKSALLY